MPNKGPLNNPGNGPAASPDRNEPGTRLYNDFYDYFNPSSKLEKDFSIDDDDVASWAYAANQTQAFGGVIGLSQEDAKLGSFSVIMSNWNGWNQDGDGDGQTRAEGDGDDLGVATGGYQTELTLELYKVDRSEGDPKPGQQIAEITESHHIKGREIPDTTNDGYAGFGTDSVVDWDLDGVNPGTDEILFMVRMDNVDDPSAENYDALQSLNIAAADAETPPDVTAGNNPDDGVYWRSENFTDGEIDRFDGGEVLARATEATPPVEPGSNVAGRPTAGPTTLVDFDGGPANQDPQSFTFDGVEFQLDTQPGKAVTAEHEVVRTADGGIEIRLQEGADDGSFDTNSKVTYSADLPETTKRVGLDYTYGQDLEESTPTFSNLQAFFRRDPDDRTPEPKNPDGAVKSQFLVGSDQANTNSPFAGNIAREFNGDEGPVAFVNNAGFPTSGKFNLVQHNDGHVDTTTTVDGVDEVTNDADLDPDNEIGAFALDQLLLQVETVQDDTSFQDQFGDQGQVFGFDDLQVTTAGPELTGQPGRGPTDPGLDTGSI